ncbi:MAG: hypothetical protein ACREXR_00410 [Gammaproteobacteria bacterium]
MPGPRQTGLVQIATRGVATSFSEFDVPKEYCLSYENMFANAENKAEKRPGLSSFSTVGTGSTITAIHELVKSDGTIILFASAFGTVYKSSNGDTDGTWTQVYEFNNTAQVVGSISMGGRQIFFNGIDRNVYTTDGTTFFELRSVLAAGRATASTSGRGLRDSTINNWTATEAAQFDVVYYPTLSAYGLITAVASAELTHTSVGLSGATGVGYALTEPASLRTYQVIDTVALNIVALSGSLDKNNLGILGTGSSANRYTITNVSSFPATEARVGDFVYNVNKNAVTKILDIATSSIGIVPVSGSVQGEEVRFLKSSMPIATRMHSHYQRVYMVDARDEQKVRISGPNNPQNLGGSTAGTYDIGTLQPRGERITALHSFQRFFIVASTKNIYFYEGTNPIASTGATLDFEILGSFPVGLKSANGIGSIGNDVLFVTDTGISATTLKKSAGQLTRLLKSAQLDKSLRTLINTVPDTDVIMVDYPKRSWLLTKIGSELFVFNYANIGLTETTERSKAEVRDIDPTGETKGSWHVFNGAFANQRCFFVRQNGDLLTGSEQGVINRYDQGLYSDLTNPIPTRYETSWQPASVRNAPSRILRRAGKAIRPYIEAGAPVAVTISVVAPFAHMAKDTVTVTAAAVGVIGVGTVGGSIVGGTKVFNPKVSLRWAGEEFKLTFETNSTTGPFVLGDSIIYYGTMGSE